METTCQRGDRVRERISAYKANGGLEINERVEALAGDKVVRMAQIALAWLFHKDHVDAPLAGVTSLEQLADEVETLEVSLSSSVMMYLKEPYEAIPVVSHE